MGFEVLTQQKIDELLSLSKKVTNPQAREKSKGKHTEKNFKVIDDTGEMSFNLYLRQNTVVADDFSCGLSWNMPSGEIVTLTRYNGSAHPHKNALEDEKLKYECHVHTATEKYIAAGKKPEGFAVATDRYQTLTGALHCLMLDCNITGVTSEADQPGLGL